MSRCEYGRFAYRCRGATFIDGIPVWEILDGERVVTTYVGHRQALHDFVDRVLCGRPAGDPPQKFVVIE